MSTANYQQLLPLGEVFKNCSSPHSDSNHAANINRSCQSYDKVTTSENEFLQQSIIGSLTELKQDVTTNNCKRQTSEAYNESEQQLRSPTERTKSETLLLNGGQPGNTMSLSQITRECSICAIEQPYSQFLGNYSEACRHHERTVCDSCVYTNTKFLVENTSIYDDQVQCPEQNCNIGFDFQTIRDILLASGKSHIVFEKYDRNLINRRLEEMTEFIWCAHECGSGQLHDLEGSSSPEVVCIKCQLRTCFKHRTVWHTGMTCAEYDLQQSQLPDDGTCAWLDQNTKRCPQCRWYIEKNSGCNEMKCRRCHHKFCWECQADYKLISTEGKSSHRSWCSHYKPKLTKTSGQHQTQRWCNVQ